MITRVLSCGCGECVKQHFPIIGKVVSTDSPPEGLLFASVFYKDEEEIYADSQG